MTHASPPALTARELEDEPNESRSSGTNDGMLLSHDQQSTNDSTNALLYNDEDDSFAASVAASSQPVPPTSTPAVALISTPARSRSPARVSFTRNPNAASGSIIANSTQQSNNESTFSSVASSTFHVNFRSTDGRDENRWNRGTTNDQERKESSTDQQHDNERSFEQRKAEEQLAGSVRREERQQNSESQPPEQKSTVSPIHSNDLNFQRHPASAVHTSAPTQSKSSTPPPALISPQQQQRQSLHNLSHDYAQLQQAWMRQVEENLVLKQQLNNQRTPDASVALASTTRGVASPNGASTTFRRTQQDEFDRELAQESGARRYRRSDENESTLYSHDIQLQDLLTDHKRLRQRLRSAQRAIEALASTTEPGGAIDVDARASDAGGPSPSASQNARSSAAASTSQYSPSTHGSQYAHMPPARAVLKLLHRLEREEEAYLNERDAWKQERRQLGEQITTLTSEQTRLNSLLATARETEAYYQQKELEHKATYERISQDRMEERKRWSEVEADLRANVLKERIRYEDDLSKVNQNESYYKEKYEAILDVLRKYEHERTLPTTQESRLALEQMKYDNECAIYEMQQQQDKVQVELQVQRQRNQELEEYIHHLQSQHTIHVSSLEDQFVSEQRQRDEVEQLLKQVRGGVTKDLAEKLNTLKTLQHRPDTRTGSVDPQSHTRDQQDRGEQIALAYRVERELKHARRDSDRGEYFADSYSGRRGRPRSHERTRGGTARSYSSSSSSSRSSSPSSNLHARFQPHRVASAQQILAMLPPAAQVHGDIELLLPEHEQDRLYVGGYQQRTTRSSMRGEYSLSPSRSRSTSRGRTRFDDHRMRYDDGEHYTPTKAEAKRRRSRSQSLTRRGSLPRASPSHLVGPLVNGHGGVSIRVSKSPSASRTKHGRVSTATKIRVANKAAAAAYQDVYSELDSDVSRPQRR